MEDPLSIRNIIAGIIITVIGGVIIALIIQDARFAPRSTPTPDLTNQETAKMLLTVQAHELELVHAIATIQSRGAAEQNDSGPTATALARQLEALESTRESLILPTATAISLPPSAEVAPLEAEPSASDTSLPTEAPVSPPERLVRDYFQAINNREYEQSWQMLTPNFKDIRHCCDSEGNYEFQPYVDWWDKFERVEIVSTSVEYQSSEEATVTTRLRYHRVADASVTTAVSAFKLVWENDRWFIDDQ